MNELGRLEVLPQACCEELTKLQRSHVPGDAVAAPGECARSHRCAAGLLLDEARIDEWCPEWVARGVDAIKTQLAADRDRGAYCVGQAPTLGDVYLVPRVEGARRFKIDLFKWPLTTAVMRHAELVAFRAAAFALQPEAA